MSSEVLIRTAVVVGVVGAALAVALGARRWTALRAGRLRLDLSGIEARVVLFSDRSCGNCRKVRSMLDSQGIDYVEVTFEENPDRWRRIGVEAVPLVVIRNAEGRSVLQVAGVPSKRRLRRALRHHGVGVGPPE